MRTVSPSVETDVWTEKRTPWQKMVTLPLCEICGVLLCCCAVVLLHLLPCSQILTMGSRQEEAQDEVESSPLPLSPPLL